MTSDGRGTVGQRSESWRVPATSATRRAVIRALGAAGFGTAALGGASTPVRAATTFRPAVGPTIGVEPVAAGLTAPLDFAPLPGSDGGALVADQVGRIHRIGAGDPTTYLDLTDRLVPLGGYEERGLLGIALHPAFTDNGRFYVRYSAPSRPGTPAGYDHTFVLSEFRAGGGAADPDSERTLLEIPEPQPNHNAGGIAFGPEGLLHVGVGDGGGANDVGTGHVDDWYAGNDGGNGQDVEANLLGSVLRIDVDAATGDRPYGIPDDNPLVGRDGLDEHYAWGFRNPWGLSFDGGDLYVADVGQDRFEEVNLVEAGGNYGWNVREGPACFDASAPGSPPETCPTRTPDGEPLREPIVAYPHRADGGTVGVAVIGGHVYRGDAVPALGGAYVFGDWRLGGRLFAARPPSDGTRPWPIETVSFTRRARNLLGERLLGIGRDADGGLFALTTDASTVSGTSGAVHRLVAAAGDPDPGTGTRATDDATATATPGQPGFGALGALAGLAGALGALSRRRGD